MQAAAARVLLGDGHCGVVTTLEANAKAFRNEVQVLGEGDVRAKGCLVLVGVAGPVVVLPAVPLGKT